MTFIRVGTVFIIINNRDLMLLSARPQDNIWALAPVTIINEYHQARYIQNKIKDTLKYRGISLSRRDSLVDNMVYIELLKIYRSLK